MENEGLYKVLIGDPFGGYSVVRSNMSKEAADKLSFSLQEDCDYFTTTMVTEMENKIWR